MAILAPIFFSLIYLEYRLSKKSDKEVYIAQEGFSHIMTLAGQQVINLFYFAITFIPYQHIHKSYSLIDWTSPFYIQFIFTFIFVDFLWYWAHRASHRVNIFVASHTTHHQAEDYNLLSSFRQSWTSRLMIFIFFIPMAFLGVAPEVIMMTQGLSIFIQFLTHLGIKHISFGRLDYILISPAAHYAHHGVNSPYLDKNYGGVLSIWDHLFGTYVTLNLNDPPHIGLKNRINHHDPIIANLDYYKKMLFVFINEKKILNKFLIFVQSPEQLSLSLKKLKFKENCIPLKFNKLNRKDFRSLFIQSFVQLTLAIFVVILWPHIDWTFRFLLAGLTFTFIIIAGKNLCSLASSNKIKSKLTKLEIANSIVNSEI